MFVESVRLLTVDNLVNSIKLSKRVSAEITKAKVRTTMGNNDEDLQVGSMRINLRCAITRTRISVPGRGAKCGHLQCFDLGHYLEAYQWYIERKCPVCNAVTDVDDLVVDDLIGEILRETSDDVDEVEFNDDGSWKKCLPPSTSNDKGRRRSRQIAPQVIDDTGTESGANPAIGVASAGKPVEGGEDCPICLDSSSDDEDDGAQRKPPAPSSSSGPALAAPASENEVTPLSALGAVSAPSAVSSFSVPSGPEVICLSDSDDEDTQPTMSVTPKAANEAAGGAVAATASPHKSVKFEPQESGPVPDPVTQPTAPLAPMDGMLLPGMQGGQMYDGQGGGFGIMNREGPPQMEQPVPMTQPGQLQPMQDYMEPMESMQQAPMSHMQYMQPMMGMNSVSRLPMTNPMQTGHGGDSSYMSPSSSANFISVQAGHGQCHPDPLSMDLNIFFGP